MAFKKDVPYNTRPKRIPFWPLNQNALYQLQFQRIGMGLWRAVKATKRSGVLKSYKIL